ncbi:MAG: hypothetical protein ACTSXQ_01425 [Alphaproteobacteria bacterium]
MLELEILSETLYANIFLAATTFPLVYKTLKNNTKTKQKNKKSKAAWVDSAPLPSAFSKDPFIAKGFKKIQASMIIPIDDGGFAGNRDTMLSSAANNNSFSSAMIANASNGRF